jgi:hypothetical protein
MTPAGKGAVPSTMRSRVNDMVWHRMKEAFPNYELQHIKVPREPPTVSLILSGWLQEILPWERFFADMMVACLEGWIWGHLAERGLSLRTPFTLQTEGWFDGDSYHPARTTIWKLTGRLIVL